MDINLLLQIDDLALDLNKTLKPQVGIQNAVGFMLASTKDSENIKIAIRPRAGNLSAPAMDNQNPTLNVDDHTRYMQVCLSPMPPYNTELSVTCDNTQSDIAIEIDKDKTYLVSLDGGNYEALRGADIKAHFSQGTTFDAYTDKVYPAYVSEIFCMPTDLGFLYDGVNASNNDAGLLIRYQVDDSPIRTYSTATNIDLPNMNTAKFMQAFIGELNALNLGPMVRLELTNLDTSVTTVSGPNTYNILTTIYTGNMGRLELGQAPGTLMGIEAAEEFATPTILRFHVYNDTSFNGVGIKGKGGNTSGYVDMYPLLFGTAVEFVEINSCGIATQPK